MSIKKKMKIMHVLKSSVYSGAENVVITIIQKLIAEFDFLYVSSEGSIRLTLEERKIPFALLDKFDKKNLKRVIKEYKPDIIHAHDFSASVLCAMCVGKIRLISQLHYDPPWVRRWNAKTITYTLCFPKIAKLLIVSETSFSNMVFSKIYLQKAKVIANPIDISKIRDMSKKSTEMIKAGDQGCDVIFVGRFVEQKNPQRFIHLMHLLKRSGFPNIKAEMLGCGELEGECRLLIKSLDLDDNIEMKGFQKNPYSDIRKAKLLCMTSRWEGYGLVLVEANSLGVPVVSSRTAGAEEVLGKDAEELCENDEEFLKKISLLLNNQTEYNNWKSRSLCRAEKVKQIDDYMKDMKNIYWKCMG